MKYSREQLQEKFGNRLVGKNQMKRNVIEAVNGLPEDIIDYVTKNVWFVSSFDDAWGFVMTGDELQGKHLIFLSDDLFSEPKRQIIYTIVHEIGHVILKHRNAILKPQSDEEIENQELEADRFANKFVTKY